ncbi:2-oxoacid dehydrogenases acyltransferase-domain-containing protein [Cytidiella melzeri]|nr:2-oxoacid dehydrogenases acyltransferase-domain-containing protein [Cytidiella melzeri]
MMLGRLTQLRGRPAIRLRPHYFHTSRVCWDKVLRTFKLADIGEGITECEVIRWSVQPSAAIQSFDPLCEVQSDKASVEITSPFDGVVKELLAKEGEVVKVGGGLCVIEVDSSEHPSSEDAHSASPPPHQEQEVSKPIDTQDSEPTASAPEAVPQKPRKAHPLDPNAPQETKVTASNAENVLATPSVRHFAREKQVDLAKLAPGSGKGGRVEKKDVETYLAGPKEQIAVGSTTPVSSVQDITVELGRTRYGMWKAMVKSLEIPHFGYSTSLDLTSLHELVPVLNKHIPLHYLPVSSRPSHPPTISPSSFYAQPTPPDVPPSAQLTKLTYLPILLKTLSKAMLEWPIFRSSLTPTSTSCSSSKPTLTLRPHADINIALSTPTGLYTPTLQRVDTHHVYALASQLKHLSHLGRQVPTGLTMAEMPKRGGTLTVSNIGGIGDGEGASPVLVPGGGVAIVAIGRAKWVWDVNRGDGKGERRLKVNVSWSADHRVVEGAELVAFVETWRSWVEHPQRLIGEGV